MKSGREYPEIKVELDERDELSTWKTALAVASFLWRQEPNQKAREQTNLNWR